MSMKRQHKTRRFKQVDAPDQEEQEGRMTLLVSTDAMDEEGDVVEQSWEYDSTVQFLWSHKARDFPLGHIENPRTVDVSRLDIEVSEDAEKGTLVDVVFDADDPDAEKVERKYRNGDLENSSVGFDPLEFEPFDDDEAGRFHFRHSKLREVSAVNIGANSDSTVVRKELDGVVPDRVMKSILEDEVDGETPDHTKEGRRNSKIDREAQEHIKELAEFCMGDRERGDVADCPVCKPGGHGEDDDKSGPTATVTVEAERVEEIVEQKVNEVLEAAQKGGEPEGEGQDEQESDEGEDDDALVIDGEKVIELDEERSEEPGSSSGEGSDADTSEIDLSAL